MAEVAGTYRWGPGVSVLFFLLLLGCGRQEAPGATDEASTETSADGHVGSRSCRECHARFYELWAPSHHGTAMQPFTAELAQRAIPETGSPVQVGDRKYRFLVEGSRGFVLEEAAEGEARHEVLHVMGGKNVYFLLTPRERGRLQVLPIAYDVEAREWYDTTGSMIRHAVGHPDAPVAWTDPLLTFNTSCWACHVSQLTLNYDLEKDTYESRWAEPGINCETCHGPAEEHIRIFREAEEGETPSTLGLLSLRQMDHAQRNDACAPCHAKASVISDAFKPGERYFDHFDLICLEDPDYYPDGRDLGENYTMTSWHMSPCAQSGELDCIHCHTSSGRYRFSGEKANEACLPCHASHVENAPAHTHHEEGSPGNRCIACHMPMTVFARMRRSDHSMRPPAPTLTLKHGSPNACNACHEQQDAAWADELVRAWRVRDYQAPMLDQADLVAAARQRDWTRLDDMLELLTDPSRDAVVATSLIRLLTACPDARKLPALVAAMGDPSPLVRAAAAAAVEAHAAVPQVAQALVGALSDDVRLVRVRAAGALAGWAPGDLPEDTRQALDGALKELMAAWASRPDQWHAHYNLGNLFEQQGDADEALRAYATASRLRPDVVQPLVNASMIHARRGDLDEAESMLRQALDVDGESAEAHYNLGLLLAEMDLRAEAGEHLEAAFAADSGLARAALNLAVLAAESDELEAALGWCRKAVDAAPFDPRAATMLAFYLAQGDRVEEARRVLSAALDRGAVSPEVYDLLGRSYAQRGDDDAARLVWERARGDTRLPPGARRAFAARLRVPPR